MKPGSRANWKTVHWLLVWKRPTETLVLIFFTALLLTPFPALAAVAVHVATNGNDARSGDSSHPFATIERARLAVRELTPAMSEDIHVHIHAGDYLLDCPLPFTPAGSQQKTEQTKIIGQSASRPEGANQLHNYENQLTR